MNSDNLSDRIKQIESENISEEEKKKKIEKAIDEFVKGKNKKNKEVIYFTIAFVIIGATVMIFSFSTGNYMALMILFLLALIFPLIGNLINVKRRYSILTADKSEAEHLQVLYENIYNEIDLAKLKKARNLLRFLYFGVCVGIISLLVLIIVSLMNEKAFYTRDGLTLIISLGIVFIIGIFMSAFIPSRKEKYKSLYKKEIIEKFINTTSEFKYNEPFGKSVYEYEKEYMSSKFDSKDFNKFELEDYICGNIKEDCLLEMFDLYTYYYRTYIRNGRRQESETEAFRGCFVILDIKKEFPNIKILNNKINIFDKNNLLDVNNKKFRNKFEIHTDNKDIAENFLTPQLIEFIIDFKEKYKIDFEIVFKNKIYIRFFTRDMFEPRIFGNLIDKLSIYKYYVITKFAKELVEKLNNM